MILALQDESGQYGYGEGTPRHYVTGETLEGCLGAAEELGRQIVSRGRIETFGELLTVLRRLGEQSLFAEHPSAFCAGEIACLDLWGRLTGTPLAALFDPSCSTAPVTYSAVLPQVTADVYEQLLELTARHTMEYVKIKVGTNDDLARIKRARERLGATVDIRLDANGAFDVAGALVLLHGAARHRISAIEQPVPKDDIEGLREVAQGDGALVIADESMCTRQDAERLIASDACGGFSVRLAKCGGFVKSREIIQLAASHGIAVQIGCHVGETAILSAAGRHLAALCPGYRYLEGALSRFVLEEDISTTAVEFGAGGRAPFLPGPGLGIDIDPERFARHAIPVASLH